MPPVLYEYCSPSLTNFHFRGVAAFVMHDHVRHQLIVDSARVWFLKLNRGSQVEIVFSRQKRF